MNEDRLRTIFVVILLVIISAAFFAMVRQFLLTLLFAAIFSGLVYPLYKRILTSLRGRKTFASLTTLLILVLLIIVPLLAFLGVLASQTIQITETAAPWIQRQISNQGDITTFLEKIPGTERLAPYKEELLTKLGQIVGTVGNFLVNSASTATRRTVAFVFNFCLMLYAMFFFLKDGDKILEKLLYYIPLSRDDEESLIDKFMSVSRATIKGTLIIGIVQGSLAGIAFAVLGVEGAVFWGTLMTILSIIPGLGTALVWIPAAVYLAATGHIVKAWILALFCAGIVGGADNFLRPRLVGKDIQMHDLLVLLATIGGILLFGLLGFIIGPILAALFITIWDIFGILFREKTAEK